jgi:hypothetical protein
MSFPRNKCGAGCTRNLNLVNDLFQDSSLRIVFATAIRNRYSF